MRQKMGQENVKDIFKLYHANRINLDSWQLDELLGIKPNKVEGYLNDSQLRNELGNEQFTYEGTPYDFIRSFLKVVKPTTNDIIYDLGSGYGRIVFYGASTTPAYYSGIEIVPERVLECQKIKKNLKIDNVDFVCKNVKYFNFSDGTIFFLFNPFCFDTLEIVIKKIEVAAMKRRLKITSWGGPSEQYLLKQKWLKNITPRRHLLPGLSGRLYFFESQ